VQKSGAAAGVRDYKNRLRYLYLLVVTVKNGIEQAENKRDKLVQEPQKNKPDRKKPDPPAKLPVRLPDYFSQNTVTNVVKRRIEIFHETTIYPSQHNIKQTCHV
jgi:hypothetical protein